MPLQRGAVGFILRQAFQRNAVGRQCRGAGAAQAVHRVRGIIPRAELDHLLHIRHLSQGFAGGFHTIGKIAEHVVQRFNIFRTNRILPAVQLGG